jgi:DNA-binding beta-propeller fold protein YncE
MRNDMPAQLAIISVPMQPNVLAWSADGAYLASAVMGGGGNIFIVDVARASVMKTLKAGDGVQRLAFSPDGTWLAVAIFQILPADEKPGQLIVFDVPTKSPA